MNGQIVNSAVEPSAFREELVEPIEHVPEPRVDLLTARLARALGGRRSHEQLVRRPGLDAKPELGTLEGREARLDTVVGFVKPQKVFSVLPGGIVDGAGLRDVVVAPLHGHKLRSDVVRFERALRSPRAVVDRLNTPVVEPTQLDLHSIEAKSVLKFQFCHK